jgi:putative membrane protein
MFIRNLINGAIIGIANIIPGVSGGTMAVILNIYDQLIGSISDFKKNPKSSLRFLIPIVLGAGAAIILCSNGLAFLLENHYMITTFFFIGIIVGSIPMIYRRATEDGFKPAHIIPFFITLGIMILTMLLETSDAKETVIRSLDVIVFFQLVFCSAVAAICMLIPGISGSFVMLLFGVYTTIITAITDFNIILLIPIALGVLLGLLVGAKIIDFVLQKFPQAAYFSILGFVIGSIPVLFDKIISTNNFKTDGSLVIAACILIVGIALTLLFDSPKLKQFFEKRNHAKQEAVKKD